MVEAERYPAQLEEALNQGVLKRLPLTFLPFVNQQLHQWTYLFPNERQSVERLLLYVAHFDAGQSSAHFRDIVELEKRMGVRQWQLSTTEQTIQNSSQLARSPYFQEWRRAVQAVFDAADRNARRSDECAEKTAHRLVLLDIPRSLPLNSATAWRGWQGMGKPIQLQLDVGDAEPKASPLQVVLGGTPSRDGNASEGILQAARSRPAAARADTWAIEAGMELIDSLLDARTSAAAVSNPVLLSYGRLDSCGRTFPTR